jgi:hypothetical protein
MQTALRFTTALSAMVFCATDALAQKAEPQRHALLVGCTHYENPKITKLEGPANDVLMLRDLLRSKYGFADAGIVILSEAAGKERGKEYRPIRENIQREFEALARRAQKGDKVVVLLSGHGSRQPDSKADDPERFEPDGLEEIFLPADTGDYVKEQRDGQYRVGNAIVDHELRDWLKAIRANGATIWVIVDACHSASLIRPAEVLRQVRPDKLVPADVLRQSEDKARKRVASGAKPKRSYLVPPEEPDLVALYASQSTEPTVEKELPEQGTDRKWRGLLTYTLCNVLTRAEAPLTYADLIHRIHDQYLALGRSYPTPLLEGKDRDREVLGDKEVRGRQYFRLTATPEGIWKLEAGSLHGLTVGSILAVKPPAGEPEADKPIGHVEIVERGFGLTQAEVRPCAYGALPAPKDLPRVDARQIARCELVFRDYGDLRLAIAVDDLSGKEEPVPADRLRPLTAALKKLTEEKGALVKFVPRLAEAHWLLRYDSLTSGKLYLLPAAGWHQASEPGSPLLLPPLFGPIPEGYALSPWIKERLARIARVQNLRALVGVASKSEKVRRTASDVNFKVEVVRFRNATDENGEPITRGDSGIVLHNRDEVGLKIVNEGREAIDVTVLYLTSDYGIQALFPKQVTVDNRVSAKPLQIDLTLNAKTIGLEHVLVIAVKAKDVQEYANFSFLAQPDLEQATREMQRTARGTQDASLGSPLGQLFQNALYAEGKTRGGDVTSRESAFQLLSWTVSPRPRPTDEKKK